MAISTRSLRHLVLLCALLPGLLLTGSEHQRVCLHALAGAEEICLASVEALGCCAQQPAGPRVTSNENCVGCCVELPAPSAEQVAAAPATTVLAQPPRFEVFCAALPAPRARTLPVYASPPTTPGRAPTPLRI